MQEKHPLAKYAEESGRSLTEIARQAKCSRQTLYRIMSGGENTTLEMLRRISAATDDNVSVTDLIDRKAVA